MKPESWPVAEEAHWKTWKFKDIITSAMEEESLRLRKELASFEEKFTHQQRLHEAVKSELETERAHKATLQQALENAYSLIRKGDKEASNLRRLLRDLYRQRDRLNNYIQQIRGSAQPPFDSQSGNDHVRCC
jgi:chromosome segregation ATPase